MLKSIKLLYLINHNFVKLYFFDEAILFLIFFFKSSFCSSVINDFLEKRTKNNFSVRINVIIFSIKNVLFKKNDGLKLLTQQLFQ